MIKRNSFHAPKSFFQYLLFTWDWIVVLFQMLGILIAIYLGLLWYFIDETLKGIIWTVMVLGFIMHKASKPTYYGDDSYP